MDARISVGLPAHPKTKKLMRRIGEGGAFRLVCLFLWAAANRSDGDLSGMTDEDIELAVDWAGEDGQFVDALVAVGYLDGSPGAYRIHDWAEHNPWAAGAEARSEKSRWAALCKRHGRAEAARLMPDYASRLLDALPESASGTLDALPESASGTRLAESGSAPSPSPSPSPSPEKLQSANADLSPEPAAPDSDDDDPPGMPKCPVRRIIALYHEILPELPPVHELPEQSVKCLRQRWRSDPDRQTLDWWRGFFEFVRKCPFLMGEKTDFTADLLWLVRPTNFAKTLNGNYEERAA